MGCDGALEEKWDATARIPPWRGAGPCASNAGAARVAGQWPPFGLLQSKGYLRYRCDSRAPEIHGCDGAHPSRLYNRASGAVVTWTTVTPSVFSAASIARAASSAVI